MVNRLLTMGCSFSCNAYPEVLQEKLRNVELDNWSRHSCGNKHIMRSVIFACYKHYKKYKTYDNLYVIVQWSGLHRVEKLVTKKLVFFLWLPGMVQMHTSCSDLRS